MRELLRHAIEIAFLTGPTRLSRMLLRICTEIVYPAETDEFAQGARLTRTISLRFGN